jgi:hypothetical protein
VNPKFLKRLGDSVVDIVAQQQPAAGRAAHIG